VTTTVLQNETVRLLNSRLSFVVLQVLDLATTLLAFHSGAFEVNPMVARLTHLLGPFGGVFCSKVIACLIVLRVRRLVWVVNLFYTVVICWNVLIFFALTHARH
jgi:hypothetical protein